MSATAEQVNGLLDALHLELLNLIEQQTQCRTNIERHSNGGQLLLAKTRYVQGSQSVSIAQIPTENSVDFKPLALVSEKQQAQRVSGSEIVLERAAINKAEGYVEPLHFFGVLVPSSLRLASQQFKKCVDLSVESANIQREMLAVMDSIEKLKKIQKSL